MKKSTLFKLSLLSIVSLTVALISWGQAQASLFSGYSLPWGPNISATLMTKGNNCTSTGCGREFHDDQLDFDIQGHAANGIIYSAKAGTVVFVKQSQKVPGTMVTDFHHANMIIIKHSDTEYSWYVHIAYHSALVSTGDVIGNGRPLAVEGDTGMSDGIHLHFMVSSSIPDLSNFDPMNPNTAPWPPSGSIGTVDFNEVSWDQLTRNRSYTSSNSPSDTSGCNGVTTTGVTLFDDINCSGLSKTYSDPACYPLSDFDNKTSSIKMGPGSQLTVYDDPTSSDGGSRLVTSDMWNLEIAYYTNPNNEQLMNNSISNIDLFPGQPLICISSSSSTNNNGSVQSSCVSPTPEPSLTPTPVTPDPGSEVFLYTLNGYTGSLVWHGTGFSNEPNANVRSMTIPSGWSAKTWRGDNRSGEERCWDSSQPNLEDNGWHNAIQSVEVFNHACATPTPVSGEVVTYYLNGYTGDVVWRGGTGFSNDPAGNARSMTIPQGWSIKTWRGDNRSGEERCWTSSQPNLEDHGWHNAIQSVEVSNTNVCPTPVPTSTPTRTATPTSIVPTTTPTNGPGTGCNLNRSGVVLFDNYYCGYPQDEFLTPGSYNLNSFSDRTSSIYVQQGWSVRIYDNEYGSGSSRCITGSMWHLDVDTYDDGRPADNTTSSVVVSNSATCPAIPTATPTPTFTPTPIPTSSNPPNAPSNLTGSGASESSIVLQWVDNSDNESRFRIYRWNGAQYDIVGFTNPNVTTWTDNGLPCGRDQYYLVDAVNQQGSSNPITNMASTQSCTRPMWPSNLTVTNVSQNSLDLSWQDNSNNEDGFVVLVIPPGQLAQIFGYTPANHTSIHIDNLQCGTTYGLEVDAYNKDYGSGMVTSASTLICLDNHIYLPLVIK